MNKRVWILLLALAVLIAGAAVAYNTLVDQVETDNMAAAENTTPASAQVAENPNLAADFTVYDREGNAHSLTDFRGKPVIVNFWASWCSSCKSRLPDYQVKFQEYGEDIHFLMVNLTDGSRETVETAWNYVAGQGYTFPVYYDTAYSAAAAYSVYSIPATYFIDENGVLVAYAKGPLSIEKLQTGIDMVMGE